MHPVYTMSTMPTQLRVLITRSSAADAWVAQFVELDIVTQAKNLELLGEEVEIAAAAHFLLCAQEGVDPMAIGPAPADVERAFLATAERIESTRPAAPEPFMLGGMPAPRPVLDCRIHA